MLDEEINHNPFFKGISLIDYMKQMDNKAEEHEIPSAEETLLYINQPKNSICQQITNYAIHQIDQDTYDENIENVSILNAETPWKLLQDEKDYWQQKSSYNTIEIVIKPWNSHNRSNFPDKGSSFPEKGGSFPEKGSSQPANKQSISPKKQVTLKKEMFRSLYGNTFLGENSKDHDGQMLSTLGIHSWKRKEKSLNKKETELKEKNRRQYQEIMKYENGVKQKYQNKLNTIRIDGVRDKIHERNERTHKTKTFSNQHA